MSGFAAMLVKISGWLDILFGLAHLAYWFFVQRRNLLQGTEAGLTRPLDTTNVQLATFFIGVGIILLRFADDIANLKMGRDLLILTAVVWAIRAIFPRHGNSLDDGLAQNSRVWLSRILMGLFMLVSVLHILPVVFG
jgi:hypothetical protein